MSALRRVAAPGLVLAAALAGAGCLASAPELRAEPAARAFYRGDLEAALRLSERRLQRAAGGPDETVARLDHALILAAAGQSQQAADTLIAAERSIEMLDYVTAPLEALGATLFGLLRPGYRAPRDERLLLHCEAALALLAAGRPLDAAVEARRLRVLLLQSGLSGEERAESPLAWTLCGVALAAAGAHSEAADAFAALAALPDGAERAADFARPLAGDEGALLVVLREGRAPLRAQVAYRLWVAGALRRVNVPVLVARPGGSGPARIALGGAPAQELPVLLDVEARAQQQWSREFPRVLAAAALAALPRVALQEAVTRAARDEDRPDHAARNLLAELLGFFAAEAAASALPADTRTWALLPARVAVARLVVPAGPQVLRLEWDALPQGSAAVGAPGAARRTLQLELDVPAGATRVVSVFGAVGEGWQAPLLPEPRPGADLTAHPAGLAARELLGATLSAPD